MNQYLLILEEQPSGRWAWFARCKIDRTLLQVGGGSDHAQAVINATLWIAWQETTDFEISVEVDGENLGWNETIYWGPGAAERCRSIHFPRERAGDE